MTPSIRTLSSCFIPFTSLGKAFFTLLGSACIIILYNLALKAVDVSSVQSYAITLSFLGTFFIQVLSQSPMYTTEGCQALATYTYIAY